MDDLTMALMGGHENAHSNPISLVDLGMDLQTLADRLELSPEEIEVLSAPTLPDGPTMQDRLRALRPSLNLGGGELSTDGRKVEWRMEF